VKKHTKKMFGNLMVLSLIGFITAGCSDSTSAKPDCSEYDQKVQVLYDDFGKIPWSNIPLKAPSGRNYANFVLSAPEGCATTEEIAKAKTLLMTIDDAVN
jgi:hypothetical protein